MQHFNKDHAKFNKAILITSLLLYFKYYQRMIANLCFKIKVLHNEMYKVIIINLFHHPDYILDKSEKNARKEMLQNLNSYNTNGSSCGYINGK